MDDCNANSTNTVGFGAAYTNVTGHDSKAFFRNSRGFTVKEIEVFEITD
jgi:hypothetical protein